MKKTIISVLSLLVVLLIVVFGYELILKKPVIESPTIDQPGFTDILPIELKEQYRDAKYTFVGSITVPTPCHSVTSKVNKISEKEYEIEVKTTDPTPGKVCAQVLTEQNYKVSFSAPKDIVVKAKINGVVHEVNRFVIPNDENIDTFQLKIKG